jgi:hypothetical protein
MHLVRYLGHESPPVEPQLLVKQMAHLSAFDAKMKHWGLDFYQLLIKRVIGGENNVIREPNVLETAYL